MNTDVSLGLTCSGYKSSEVASGSREADGCLLVRFPGATSRTHPATKQNLAQGATAGYCSCCSKATHVALHPAFALRGYAASKAKGPAL